MIPSIETIVEGLIAGTYTAAQAVGWLHQHAEGAANEERRYFAALALQGVLASPHYSLNTEDPEKATEQMALIATACADALVAELHNQVTEQK
jgi:hypothetical protein